jgi:hypothetical protein
MKEIAGLILEAKKKQGVALRNNATIITGYPPRSWLSSSPSGKDGAVRLRAGERRILQVLAQRHPLALTKTQAGTLSGYTSSGGTFQTYFGTLKRAGFIEETTAGWCATDAGFAFLGTDIPPMPTTPEELIAMWKSNLRRGEATMLDILVAKYPRGLTKEALGEASGYTHTGGTFGTYIGTLRRNNLAVVNGDEVKAGEILFQ